MTFTVAPVCFEVLSNLPRRPDNVIMQDTYLMHLPPTIFTFNKPERRHYERSLDQILLGSLRHHYFIFSSSTYACASRPMQLRLGWRCGFILYLNCVMPPCHQQQGALLSKSHVVRGVIYGQLLYEVIWPCFKNVLLNRALMEYWEMMFTSRKKVHLRLRI